jgi:hypothetical protein
MKARIQEKTPPALPLTACSAGELKPDDLFTFSRLFGEPVVKCVGRSNRDRVLYVHLSWDDAKIKPLSVSKSHRVFKQNAEVRHGAKDTDLD